MAQHRRRKTHGLYFQRDYNVTGDGVSDELALARMRDEATGLVGAVQWPSRAAAVPASIELHEDRLYWKWVGGAPSNYVQPLERDQRGMLDQFQRITDGRGVLKFARRYGVLQICEHGLPATHNPDPLPSSGFSGCRPLGWNDAPWEPVEQWLHFARQAAALLRIAAALHRDQRPDPSAWATVYEDQPDQRGYGWLSDAPSVGRFNLADCVNTWLILGGVRPHFEWFAGSAPRFMLSGGTFGLVAIQLMLAISQAHAIAVCDGCKQPYPRVNKRAPQAGRANYCDACSPKVAAAQRQARRRQKIREHGPGALRPD